MQFKTNTTQHFETPPSPKLTPDQQRMEQLWGLPHPTREDWDNYPDDDQ